MKSTFLACNLNSGEFSPKAIGRADYDKYYSGVRILENFLPYQIGGAMFFPGTIYAGETKNSYFKSFLLPFQYSADQSYCIEAGQYYMRFWAIGGQVVTGTVAAWAGTTGYIVGNLVVSSTITYVCQVAHTSGTFATDLAAGYWFAITEAAGTIIDIITPYLRDDLAGLSYAQDSDTMYIVGRGYAPQKLVRLASNAFAINPVLFKRGPFLDDNITAITITVTTGDTGDGKTLTASAALFQAGHIGSLWRIKDGVVKITGYTSSTIVTGNVQAEPDGTAGNLATGGAAVTDWAEGAFSNVRGFPEAVMFHEGRLYYGNTLSQKQTFWGSVINAYDDFDKGSAADSDAVTFKLSSAKSNAIRFISSAPSILEFGTAGGTFSNSSNSSSPIAPSAISMHPDTDYGAAKINPARLSSHLYYVQKNLFNIRELTYSYLDNREKSPDMNKYADHILRDGGGIVDLCSQQSPNERIWTVRADGQLAILTRNSEEGVLGWCRRTTDGTFESIIGNSNDGSDDTIWVLVNRTIGGVTKRYIEYFSPEMFTTANDAIRTDCTLTYTNPVPGSLKTTLEDLDHLEGKTVYVTLDGANGGYYTVTGGAITINKKVTVAHIGLYYEGTIIMLPLNDGSQRGIGVGKKRRAYSLSLRVVDSLGLTIGQGANLKKVVFQTPNLPAGTPPALFTGLVENVIDGYWDNDVQIVIKQPEPLPLHISSIMIESEVNER